MTNRRHLPTHLVLREVAYPDEVEADGETVSDNLQRVPREELRTGRDQEEACHKRWVVELGLEVLRHHKGSVCGRLDVLTFFQVWHPPSVELVCALQHHKASFLRLKLKRFVIHEDVGP